ncbi:MAG: tetratricopeptide repeat protein, partial [Cyanobacteria bacterium]|nr:tetratricopeptide repeat protein [Cyanobacteriota bacterium]
MNSRTVASLLLAGSISVGCAILPARGESTREQANPGIELRNSVSPEAELRPEISTSPNIEKTARSRLLASSDADARDTSRDMVIPTTVADDAEYLTTGSAIERLIADADTTESSSTSDTKNESDSAPKVEIPGESTPPRADTGLDSKTLKSANQGDWKSVAQKLEKLTQGKKGASKDRAWLAFTYMFLGRCDDLESMYHELETNETKISAEEKGFFRVIKAFNQVCTGKLEDADATMSTLPRRHVNDAFVNFALAAVAGKRGKAGAASEYCKRAVDLDPRFAWGWRTLGYLQLRWLNLTTDAENSFEKALAIEPNQSEVREMLINSYISHNDFDKAIDVAKTGIKTASQDATSYNRLAQIYLQQWRLREALGELESSIKADPSNANYYRSRASIKRYQGDFTGAVKDQEKAVELSKDKSFELIELASLNADAGQIEKAVDNLEKAITLQPDNRTAHDRLAALLTQQRRW